jgi:hypothetical protein
MSHHALSDGWALWPVAAVRGAGMPIRWLTGLREGDGTAALRRLLDEPMFLAALMWQNPDMAGNWAARPGFTISAYRASVLARYAQRYCAKNDSIGFFGPTGWARLEGAPSEQDGLTVTGAGGIRRAEVCFEHWAIWTLAKVWQASERVRPHLPRRLSPAVHDDGRQLHRPYRTPVAVGAWDEPGVRGDPWPVPPGVHPQDHLRTHVAALPDAGLRAELLSDLDGLERALAEVAKVADRPGELAEALTALDSSFTALTDTAALRSKRQATAGRTIAYLDCRRDTDVAIPSRLVDRLAAPLSLLLQSARWFTAELAEAAEEHLQRTYASLARSRDQVRLSDLYLASADLLSGAPGTAVHQVAADFGLRWAEVLGTRSGHVASAELEPLVHGLFAARQPGWAAARHHSPDLMLAWEGGAPTWVLGELHLAMNTLEQRFFHTLCDDPAELVQLTAHDMAGGRIVPCYPYGPEIDSRRYPPLAVHVPDRYLYWSHSDDLGPPAGAKSWPATALLVRRESRGLVAGPQGGWSHPVSEFFGEYLSALAVNRFRLPAPGPRLAIDDLVVRRATWHFTPGELPGGTVVRNGYRPQVLSDWLRSKGLPQHLFCRVPGEAKPFYVDLAAPLLVGNLARSWRRAGTGPVELQEMLPAPGDLWLNDAQGRHYTSEFRMIAVDGASRRLPGLEGAQQ